MGITKFTAGATACLLCVLSAPSAVAATPLDGTWRTEGYATVVEFTDGQARFHEVSAAGCLPGGTARRVAVSPNGTVRFDAGFTVRARGDHAVQQYDGSVGQRELRRVAPLPRCEPGDTFDTFWATFAENYPFFRERGIDWAATRERFRPRVRPGMPDDDLFAVLTEMIAPLGDAHTGIIGGDHVFIGHRPGTTFPTEDLEARVHPYVTGNVGPLTEFGRGRIGFTRLADGVTYLRVIAFAGYTDGGYDVDAAELDRALDAVFAQPSRGLVIDLRINGGGSDGLGLALAGRLTAHPYFAYAKQVWTGSAYTAPERATVRPAAPGHTGPVVVLTSGSTMSAGETLTQALMERSPSVLRVGDNTQGVFSDTMERHLPNGWRFILPNERFLTLWGQSFDGYGVPPHVRVPTFTAEDFLTGKDPALDRALGLLRRG